MRLICPNCDAQYEVPSEVIPEGGRDVQCSNCGDTWFQAPPDLETTETDQVAASAPDQTAEPEPEPATDTEPDSVEMSETTEPAASALEQSTVDIEEPYEEDEPESIVAEPVARPLDPAVAKVLKEEAEHEATQRRNEQSAGLETQPDLGLQEAEDDAGRRTREARERMPKAQDEAPAGTDTAIAQALASRRELLPDVEEINSSLSSDRDQNAGSFIDDEQELERQKSGFLRGFSLIVVLAVILTAVYVMAPKITQSVPAAGPVVTGYVAFVDRGRAALGDRVKGILEWLDAKASNSVP